ncbi:MAG: carboxypeptidase-like regulatory domain-containing protein [Desulfobacterales bacterium]|nr:carboxypeptidase-like regulatory domain-containing protein [Desulfobacterales bacterium]
MRKTVAVLLALLALGSGLAFAQNRTSLNIQCNEVGAEVYINGRLAGKTTPNFSFLVPQGQRPGPGPEERVPDLRDRGPGRDLPDHPERDPPADRRGGHPAASPPPELQPPDQRQRGRGGGHHQQRQRRPGPLLRLLAPGSYTLVVRAPGYTDYVENLVISGNRTVNAVLQGSFAAVTVVSNVQGADVVINEGQPFSQRGKAPFTANLPMGGALYYHPCDRPGLPGLQPDRLRHGPAYDHRQPPAHDGAPGPEQHAARRGDLPERRPDRGGQRRPPSPPRWLPAPTP